MAILCAREDSIEPEQYLMFWERGRELTFLGGDLILQVEPGAVGHPVPLQAWRQAQAGEMYDMDPRYDLSTT